MYFQSQDQQALAAARMGLGMCGVLSHVTLPVVPQFYLKRRRWMNPDITAFFLDEHPMLKAKHDMYHYYIHPKTQTAWPMTWEETTAEDVKAEDRPCRTALEQWEDSLETRYGVDGLPLVMRWDNCSDISYRSYTHAVDMEAQPLWNGEWFVSLSTEEEGEVVMELMSRFEEAAKKANEVDGEVSGLAS